MAQQLPGGADLAPLLTTKWEQCAPYNNLCPKGTSSEDHGATGCVATAMAQVMYYHRWPERGTGSHQNTECEEQVVDFSQSVYDWENMLPSYDGAYTEKQADAVARLMNDVGCSVDMLYGDESYTYCSSSMPALTTYFGYDKGMNYKYRYYYTNAQWAALLHAELEAQRPILLGAGTQRNVGHAFVIDGCDDQGLYHVNWGWGGLSDGYYSIDIMDPEIQGTGGSMGGFQFEQEAIIGIQKDNGSEARPDLVMNGSLQYKSTETPSFTFSVLNYGLGDFTGCVGLKVLDSNRALKNTCYYTFEDLPITFINYEEITIPLNMLSYDEGDYFEPFYTIDGKEVTVDNMLALPAQLSAITTYQLIRDAATGKLKLVDATPNIAMVYASDIKVEECNVGSSPKVSLTFSVADNSPVEYNDLVCINLYDAEGNRVAQGHGSTYLQPGESKHIVIDSFLDDNNELYLLEAKDYAFHVLFYRGSLRYYLTEEPISFTAQQGEAPNITSVEFSLASESVAKGETLKVTVKVTNEGGPTSLSYSLSLFPSGYYQEIDYKNFYMEAKAHDVTTTDVTMVINQEPGEYFLDLFDYNDEEWLYLYHSFTVTVQVTVDGVIYEKSGTSSAIVVGLDNTITSTSIVNILDKVTIDGYNLTVSGFGENCFKDRSFTSITYPINLNFAPNCFQGATVKYLDLTQSNLTIDSDALKGCKITGKLTINNENFSQANIANMGAISTLVCVDAITNLPSSQLSNVSTAIVPNSQVSTAGNLGTSVKVFGDVSEYPVSTFFSFVAGEDLYFAEDGDVEAFVPATDPLQNGKFMLEKKSGIAKEGTALFLRIKENASNKVIPSVNGQTTPTISSTLKGQMKTWLPDSGKTYYAIHKTDNGYDGYIWKYTGKLIPPCVAVIELDPSSQNNSAKSLQLTIGDGTTEIEELQDCEDTNICFDLNGNPTDANAHGIIIINGKKIIRK